MDYVLIRLYSNLKVCQIIDTLVVEILEFYGLILSMNWYEKLHGYFATDWSHMWLPYNGKTNQIFVDREKHMKYSLTDFDEENEPIVFTNSILEVILLNLSLAIFQHRNPPFQ